MDKYLPDNIDDFFASNLGKLSEEPDDNVWDEIDKRLSRDKNNKHLKSSIQVIGETAIFLFCICMPYFISDSFMNDDAITKNYGIRYKSLVLHKTTKGDV